MRAPFLLACATLAAACVTILPYTPEEVPDTVLGARPAYIGTEAARAIAVSTEPLSPDWHAYVSEALDGDLSRGALPSIAVGRLVVDTLHGLYVLPLADTTPTFDSTRYVRVWGITTAEVVGVDEVRVSNFEDAVTLRFVGPDSVAEVSRVPGRFAYPAIDRRFVPGGRNGFAYYFECYERARGFFGGWVPDTLAQPQCLAAF